MHVYRTFISRTCMSIERLYLEHIPGFGQHLGSGCIPEPHLVRPQPAWIGLHPLPQPAGSGLWVPRP